MECVHGDIRESIIFLRECEDKDFLWNIMQLLRHTKVDKSDVIYKLYDHSGLAYFIKRG